MGLEILLQRRKIGFNRNIVECKFVYAAFPDTLCTVLIETLWNVNCFAVAYASPFSQVLIETLWNVNLGDCQRCFVCLRVLIETLWNVNFSGTSRNSPTGPGFNRNIVECKCCHISPISGVFLRFNRNIVECKYVFAPGP